MSEMSGCCAGIARAVPAVAMPAPTAAPAAPGLARIHPCLAGQMVDVPGGFFDMGTDRPRYSEDLDSPARRVWVSPFMIGRTSVTNRQFAQFVEESGHRTTAEQEGWSFVFHTFLPDKGARLKGPLEAPWWRRVEGACWCAPEGPGSDVEARLDHPVTHVSWHDACAFAAHTATRLPREAEWEFAARGGRKRSLYPWGNADLPHGAHGHNTWQGSFPSHDTGEDGWSGTCPADGYAPNGYGLYAMTGNVWEWVADGFGPLPPARKPPLRDPEAGDVGPGRVMRGGSYLCHASYCARYYVHSRTHNTPDSSTGHIGFRVVADPPRQEAQHG